MSCKFFKAAALSTVLLLSTTSLYAAEVSVGGISASVGGGGVSVSVGGAGAGTGGGGGSGGVAADATIGGGGGNIASGHVDASGNKVDLSIGSGGGPLAKVDSNGNPLDGGNATSGAVNLGSLLDGIDLGGTGGGGGGGGSGGGGGGSGGGGGGFGGGAGGGGGGVVTPGVRAIASGLSAADQSVLKLRCRNVLASPHGFNRDIVQFCRMIAKL